MTRARSSSVLQGYFHSQVWQGPASRTVAAQPRTNPPSPRPDLLPPVMRSASAQAKPERGSSEVWRFAPRPELLPGMGASRVGGLRVAQQRPGNQISTTQIPAGRLRLIGEGRPIEPAIRQTMERFFGADFSGVRIRVGPAAPAIGALAFTLGEEIHFAPGLYDPSSREGMALLGHELTHVVQQREGRVANPYGSGVAIVQDPELEAEADQMGQRVAGEVTQRTLAGTGPSNAHSAHRPFVARPSIQRATQRPTERLLGFGSRTSPQRRHNGAAAGAARTFATNRHARAVQRMWQPDSDSKDSPLTQEDRKKKKREARAEWNEWDDDKPGVLTNKEVDIALWARSKFRYYKYHIILPWNNEWEGKANCHGYTVTGNCPVFLIAWFPEFRDKLASLKEGDPRIAVYMKGKVVAHSGRFEGEKSTPSGRFEHGKLTHLLIGVGVIESFIDEGLMGYDRRFILPDEKEAFDNYCRVS